MSMSERRNWFRAMSQCCLHDSHTSCTCAICPQVAFHDAEIALRWCLIIQDALMWQDWPESILKFEKFREEHNERGETVFRGPR